jgi:hypothetical protein
MHSFWYCADGTCQPTGWYPREQGDYAFNIVSSSGQFDFSDDGDVDISVELSWGGYIDN